MYRTHTCGELRLSDANKEVTLAGWIQHNRNFGGLTFIDLRDRYGITQLVFDTEKDPDLAGRISQMGREYVIQVKGIVAERYNKNKELPTGDIEIIVAELELLNASKTPPFTIEDETDGGDEQRMKYRYLDLRRRPVKENMLLRHRLFQECRNYLASQGFLEIDTPFLVNSTPEGARDFVVPSSKQPGNFYALPQSPQIFKQILMMSGYDKYFQVVKCFRDEDFRADRQPEFTQIDCEMSFIHQEDIIRTFTDFIKHVFRTVRGSELGEIPTYTYNEVMSRYGSDKPDLRFGMEIHTMNTLVTDAEFGPFKEAIETNGLVAGINVTGGATFTRKQTDQLTEFIKDPRRGMKGLITVRWGEEGIKSSVDKFFNEEQLKAWLAQFNAQKGDLLLITSGKTRHVQKALGDLRLEVANQLNLRDKNKFAAAWVVDFPMFSFDEEKNEWTFEHHPFTSPKTEHMHLIDSDKGAVLANAYDFVLNGSELCSGSIRIHDQEVQASIFRALGMSAEEAQAKFGFLLNALEFGAPPHGGCAFGFDRLAAIMCGTDSIRDVIPFPKNNAGRDLMLDAPGPLDAKQLKELGIRVVE